MHAAFLALLLASTPPGAEEPAERGQPVPEVLPVRTGEELPGDVSGEGKPPPGSPEDQALWSAAHEVTLRITVTRAQANKLQWEARDHRYDERLGELASKAGGPQAGPILELQQRYRAALAENYITLVRRWPVDPTRGCQYPMLHLASAMRAGTPALLEPSRSDARSCVASARPAAEAMAASSAALERLSAEAARLLAPPPPAAARAD